MSERHPIIRGLKTISNLVALVLVSPAAVTCWLEERWSLGGESVFGFWTHVMSGLPGLPGMYIRRAFYSLTLRHCSLNCLIGFGVLFTHRTAYVEEDVYVGAYSVVGSAHLRHGSLIGTRANLLSGSAQHELNEDGRWGASDASRFKQIEIGPHAWVGEAAVVMGNVGAGALVAAGSVVSAAVPAGVVVAGNPARFVRRTSDTAVITPRPAEKAAQAPDRADFIDWLKWAGMLLIVYGHAVAWGPLAVIPPINSKQLGVALFLFVLGYSLNRDTRSRQHVAFNRLFEVFVVGLALAFLLSAVSYVSNGRLLISNYAPFLGGVNVVFDFFPANPTTWFLGTYLHFVLLWAVWIHRLTVSMPVLLAVFAGEIVVRAVLMQTAGAFVAYMAFPNWATVFLLGSWCGQQRGDWSRRVSHRGALLAGIALVAALVAWSAVTERLEFESTFPFMQLAGPGPTVAPILTSAMVSVVYAGATWLVFLTVAPLRAPRAITFVAHNTLFIFLAHMPLIFALQLQLRRWGLDRNTTGVILMVVSVLGFGWLSEVLNRGGWLRTWRNALFDRFRDDGSLTVSPAVYPEGGGEGRGTVGRPRHPSASNTPTMAGAASNGSPTIP